MPFPNPIQVPDKFSADVRSRIMSKIRGKNTKPELQVRKLLWNSGYRYRIHYPIQGMTKVIRPDIAFPNKKIAIFIDGCFWHACPKCYREPKSNVDFWKKKISRNKERDREDTENLEQLEWTIIRIWEHEIKESLDDVVMKIIRQLNSADDRK
ncbi:MAG: very short patch repair endonuclease [Methanobacteriota archaeon]|nr:MAG: very short patch repair endonuclease [Euryarchaeota archaeon]